MLWARHRGAARQQITNIAMIPQYRGVSRKSIAYSIKSQKQMAILFVFLEAFAILETSIAFAILPHPESTG
jgi:hypothetical protein